MASDRGSIDATIRRAIENKKLLAVRYNGRSRVVEPHDYGVQRGVERLLVYQIEGPMRPRQSATGWRLLDLNKIESAEALDRTFKGSRGDAHHSHHSWDVVYARVK